MDEEKVKKAIKDLLIALGENPEKQELKRTPERVARLYKKILDGKNKDPKEVLKVSHELEHDEMVIMKNIPFYSMCEHDLLPFFGKIHIAYIPDKNKVVGINNLVKVVDISSQKLQLQERLTTEIANVLMQNIQPKGVAVIAEARHLCMEMKGLKQSETKIITSALRGIFRKDQKTREEALSLIKNAN